MFLSAMLPISNVSAAATILVDPHENIPKIGTSQLQVTGAELIPNSSIAVTQVSVAPYSAAEGDTITSGFKVERMHRGALSVDSNGTLSGSVYVTYDPYSNGPANIAYCDTISSLQRSCLLEFRYVASTTVSGGLILQQKLYFGMFGPVVTPPPATEPLTKDDCKGDKWSDFTSFGFKNQGACVSFVATKPQ